MKTVARHFQNASWVELELTGGLLGAVRTIDGPSAVGPGDLWVAPAFWDIQTNGRMGNSFSSPDLTVEQATAVIRQQASLGTARLCPTLITAPADALLRGVRTIAAACDEFPDVAARVLGIHLEGPFLSERDGYRGAHPASAIRDPDSELFRELQQASGRRICLITVAPERAGSIEFIRAATADGVVVALGHTAADGPTIRAAVAAGARLSTHLGNGIVSTLPRHPNPIWEQAGLDELSASFIADGHHLDRATLRVLTRAKGPMRTILVSDASPLAGLPPGVYGEWAVEPAGKIVVAGTPYLAGSNQGLETGLRTLLEASGWTIEHALATVTTNPARLLGRPEPRLERGQPASFVLFSRPESSGFVLKDVCVDGAWEKVAAA
jgi:N-acetylglucosamine-6-phosphate deacetylase